MTKRVQRTRTKGGGMPPGSKYVGRGTPWGNPYVVRKFGRQWHVVYQPTQTTETVRKTKAEAAKAACEYYGEFTSFVKSSPSAQKDFLDPLRGYDLACWCPLGDPCHADVLLKLLEETKPKEGE